MPSVLNCNTLSMQVSCPPKTSFLFSEWIHGTNRCWQEKLQPSTSQSAATQQFSRVHTPDRKHFLSKQDNPAPGEKKERENTHKKKIKA